MKLSQTQDYLLLIDEEAEIYQMDYYLDSDHYTIARATLSLDQYEGCAKIIAYRKLNENAKELDLPELPPFEEVDIEKEFNNQYGDFIFDDKWEEILIKSVFKVGYKAAQPKQFSLEDVKKAIEMASTLVDLKGCYFSTSYLKNLEFDELAHLIEPKYSEEEIIQSLSTQRLPKEFIVEYKKGFRKNSDGEEIGFPVHKTVELKTITNSEGKKELVGTYKY